MMSPESMIGLKVENSKYGEGIVVKVSEELIYVLFDSEKREKTYQYPLCFKSFLSLCDEYQKELFQEDVEEDVERWSTTGVVGFLTTEKQQEAQAVEASLEQSAQDALNCKTVPEFVNAYRCALLSERKKMQENGGKKYRLINGVLVDHENMSYSYIFETEEELHLPSDTKAALWFLGERIPATVVYCEDYSLMVVTANNFGDKVLSIELSAEPWKLLDLLIAHIDRYIISVPSIVSQMVCEGRTHINLGEKLKKGQITALTMAQAQPITFVWGPPGTGKTETLAKIALSHIARGHRVLMVSYSNVSVDGAVLRVYARAEEHDRKPGRILRYGYPRAKEILEHETLTAYNLALYQSPELLRKREELFEKRQSLKKDTKEYKELKEQEDAIRKRLKEKEKELVKQARFVATTVSKSVADKTLYESDFDVVIFDEASMAYIPQVVFAAGLAKKHFICLGDFKQLPPIVKSGDQSVLNHDIFEFCGITEAVERGNAHDWLCMLDVQHRMHPEIANFASNTMYHNQLKSRPKLAEERQNIINKAPFVNDALGLVDLSGMMSVCFKTNEGSRINVLSALITFGLALKIAEHHEVGVITPYNAQSRLLHAMARDANENNMTSYPITCATVHQFQGSEKDVILYDAVECYRMTKLGKMLQSQKNNYANRLFNVALSRARGKFIAVANIDYLKKRKLSKSLIFSKMIGDYRNKIYQCMANDSVVDALRDVETSAYSIGSDSLSNQKFLEDLNRAKKEIRIEIPNVVNDHQRFIQELVRALDAACKRKVKVIIRAEEIKKVPKELRRFVAWEGAAYNPITVIDRIITWFGQPLSNASFSPKDGIVPTTCRPIIRFEGVNTANAMYNFLGLEVKISKQEEMKESGAHGFAKYIQENITCEICGSPMILRHKGNSFYLGCSNKQVCKNNKRMTTEIVENYLASISPKGIRCPKCGFSLAAVKGPYGIYVKCLGLAEHTFNLDKI